ncbi:MAG TPA: hypothetical protein VF950_30080 [Planctomycetota bacterium]
MKPLALMKGLSGPGGRWRPAPPGEAHDLESRDGRRLLKVVPAAQGVRDLHGWVVRLAQLLAERSHVARAILVVRVPRMSAARLRKEWDSLSAILRPGIRDRLALVFLSDEGPWMSADDLELRGLAEALGAVGRGAPPSTDTYAASSAPTPGFFEVFKLILLRRLSRGGPLGIGDLVRRSGFSYPTVADAVKRLESSGELVRRSHRSIELAAFPRQTWSEVLALSRSLRRTTLFRDASGRPARLTALLSRIEKEAPPGVALGGVIAGRHWDRSFDLHGLPRLDLCLHAPAEDIDLDWLRRVDPALRPASAGDVGAVLAVHPVRRADPGYSPRKGRMPAADPVETLLDLHELGLHAQGEDLIQRLETPR